MTNTKFKLLDGLYIALMIVPFLCAMALKVIFSPATEGVELSGALVFLTVDLPFQPLYISEAQVNSLAVALFILGLSLYLTHGLKDRPELKRQVLAELIVEKVEGLVHENMGDRFAAYGPFVAAILSTSALSSLSSLLGLFPPTADLNIIAGWSILVFVLITHYKLKGGLGHYVKGYFEPIPLFAPMNVISEIATPVSMTFRHFGNVLSGVVISVLLAAGLGGLSNMVLGWLPGVLGDFPLLRVGIPAIFSLYFDIFSGLIQAFIFAMLTMLYISNGFPEEEYEARLKRKIARENARKEARELAKKAEIK